MRISNSLELEALIRLISQYNIVFHIFNVCIPYAEGPQKEPVIKLARVPSVRREPNNISLERWDIVKFLYDENNHEPSRFKYLHEKDLCKQNFMSQKYFLITLSRSYYDKKNIISKYVITTIYITLHTISILKRNSKTNKPNDTFYGRKEKWSVICVKCDRCYTAATSVLQV